MKRLDFIQWAYSDTGDMILPIAILALVGVGLFLAKKIGPTRVKDAVTLGMDLFDLIKLLATLRWKAARVRNIDW